MSLKNVFAATNVTVTPANTDGWTFFDDNGNGGSGSFITGPATPPLGAGSAQLGVSASNQGYILYKAAYGGTKLSDINALSYSTYVQNGNNTIAPSFQFDVDNDVTDGNTAWKGRIVYEPYYNGTVTDGQWQNWDALSGKWWFSSPSNFGGTCGQSSPCTLAAIEASYPNIGVRNVGGGGMSFKAGSGWTTPFIGNIDNFTINDTTYDFEPLPPNTSGFIFTGSPKYVRANNGGDESARILVSNQVSEARFYIDGSATPIGGTLVGPSTSTTEWWKLNTALVAGQHAITAEVKIGNSWYDVNGSGTAYSIDTPWAEYIIPQANQYFRADDKVVRIKADDQFDQFKHMVTIIDSIGYTVNRADCSDQGNYVLCDLQNLNLSEGTYQAKTTTTTKANNRVDNLLSSNFTIDNTRPELTNFQITDIHSVYGSSISVSADATDANGVKDVEFYVTAPRAGDGACDGNGAKIASATDTTANGNTYSVTLNTSGLNGEYCLNAIAEDAAANHSSISRIKASFDNTAPVVTVTPGAGSLLRGTVTFDITVTDTNLKPDNIIWTYLYNSAPPQKSKGANVNLSTGHGTFTVNTKLLDDGNAWLDVGKLYDAAGNASGINDNYFKNYTIDNTRPEITFLNPTEFNNASYNQYFQTGPNIQIKATDVNGIDVTVLHIYKADNTPALFCPASSGDTASCDASSLPDGEYYVKAGSNDNAGNNQTVTKYFTIDSTPPDAPVNLRLNESGGDEVSNGGSTNSYSITAGWDSVAGTNHYEYRYWNSIPGDAYNAPNYYVTNPTSTSQTGVFNRGEGLHHFQVRAIDAAGNSSPWSTQFDVTYDATPPAEPKAIPGDGTTNEGPLEVTLTDTDSTATIYYTTNGSDPSDVNGDTYTGPFTVSQDGTTVKAIAYDQAGNHSSVMSATYNIAPVIDNEEAVLATTSSITITWTTDHDATSRVIYDNSPHSSLGSSIVDGYETYGYQFTTPETDTSPKVTDHTVVVTGLTPGTTYYFRTVSHGSPESVSDQISANTKNKKSTSSSSNNSSSSNSSNNNSNTENTTNTTGAGTGATGGGTQGTDGQVLAATNDNTDGTTDSSSDGSTDQGEVKAAGSGISSATTANNQSAFKWWWVLAALAILALIFALYRRRKEESEQN